MICILLKDEVSLSMKQKNSQSAAKVLITIESVKGQRSEAIPKGSRLAKLLSETPNIKFKTLFDSQQLNFYTSSCIYIIVTLHNYKYYIGSTVNFQYRMRKHRENIKSKRIKASKQFLRSYDKYGKKDYIVAILEHCKLEDLQNSELKWIKKYDSVKYGYNLTYDTRRQVEQLKPFTEAQKKPVNTYDLNGIFIKSYSSVKDCAFDLNTSSTNVSKAARVYSCTIKNCIIRYSTDNTPPIKSPHRNTGKKFYNKIICVDTGIIYENGAQAAKAIGVHVSSVTSAIRKDKLCKGLKFELYKDMVQPT